LNRRGEIFRRKKGFEVRGNSIGKLYVCLRGAACPFNQEISTTTGRDNTYRYLMKKGEGEEGKKGRFHNIWPRKKQEVQLDSTIRGPRVTSVKKKKVVKEVENPMGGGGGGGAGVQKGAFALSKGDPLYRGSLEGAAP